MAVLIRRLEELDELDSFGCGDEPLNNYLKRYALTNQQKSSIGVAYVAVDEAAPRSVIWYFNLRRQASPRQLPKEMCSRSTGVRLATHLLARLAVDRRFSGRGLGHALVSEAFKITLRVADDVGCRCVIRDAYRDRADWYARYGFVPLEGAAERGARRMFLDIKTIRMALKTPGQ